MGSCGDSCGVASEQHLCLEIEGKLNSGGGESDPAGDVDGSLALGRSVDGNAGCLSHLDGSVEENQDGDCLVLEELVMGDECGVRQCPASAVDGSLELSPSDDGNIGCLSCEGGVKKIEVVDGRLCSVVKSRNGVFEGSMLGEEYGVRARCLGSGQNGSGGDSFGSQELCPEKVKSGDEHYARTMDLLEDSVDVTAVSRSFGSRDQQGEANTEEELREQSENLAAMKADTYKLKVASMGFEMCAKHGPGNGLTGSVLEQETPDSASNVESSEVVAAVNVQIMCSLHVDGGHGVFGVMKEKSDAKIGMETVPCNHLLSTQNFEAASNTEPSSCSPGELVKQHEKTGKGINHLSSDIQNVVEEEIEHCIEVSSPRACSGNLEALPLRDSLNNFAPESALTADRSFSGPFVDNVSVAVVGNIDVSTIDTKVATCSSTLCSKEKCFDLEEALWERAPNYSVQKTVPQESYQPLAVVEDDLSNMNSCIAAEFSGQSDKEVRHYARPGCLSESSHPLVSSSSSQGRKQGRKTSQKTQRRQAASQCRNGITDLDLTGHLESFMSVRRKRSSFSKPHRASTWGLLGITRLFMPRNGHESNQIQSHVSSTAKGSFGSGKQNNVGTGSYSRKLDVKSSFTRIRLKVKLGNEISKRSTNIINTNIIHASESVCNGEMNFYHKTSSGIPSPVHMVQSRVEDEKSAKQFLPLENKMEKAKTSSDGSMVDFFTANKDSEGTMVSAVSVGDAAEDYLRASSHLEVGTLETKQERDADPTTSPDSEVSNFFPSGQPRMRCHKNCPSNSLFSSERGEDKCTASQGGGCFLEDGSANTFDMNKVKPLKKRVGRLESAGDICFDDIVASSASGNGSSNSSSSKGLSPEQIPYRAEPEIEDLRETSQVERGTEAQVCGSLKGDHSASEFQNSETFLPSAKSKGRRLQRKSDGVSTRSALAAPKSRQSSDNKKKGNQQNLTNINKLKEKRIFDHILTKENGAETGDGITSVVGQDNSDDSLAFIDVADASITTSSITEKGSPVDNAWVRCDDCHKWRRISEELADSIGQTNCRWICEDNMDKALSNCSVPQEMSNAEINAELGLPNADEEVFDIFPNSVASDCSSATAYKEYEFLRISTNQFLHRSRKSQTIDEIMVCGCKPPQDGRLGCGDGCLNRMLNIECIRGTCPCGDLCSNQQFQRRSYAKMRWDRCGKKGFGLRLEEDICRGQFLIEYVGEVLDMRTYQARLKEYASRGHKHFYFMTLSSSEVIDASAKGNLGRFINHSCDPNCRTEKWVVNGEICIGLFALRDIKKGEEVTFDYNYVRVVGAAAKKCYCGSLHCRGFIGGDPANAEIIDQVDSDEEFPEPVMLEEGETGNVSKDRTTGTTFSEGVEMRVYESLLVDGSFMAKSNGATHMEVVASEIEDSKNLSAIVSQLHTSMEMDGLKSPVSPTGPVDSVQPEICSENFRNKTFATQSEVVPLTPLLTKVSSDCTVDAKKCKSAAAGEKRVFVKSRFYIKTPGQSGILKRGKHSANQSNSRKLKDMPNRSETHSLRPKTLLEGVANCRFETVEEKLNELLDDNGGISKRKDSPRGFLQLLHLIAASGSSGNGETIQSNRDLSMILDAILKTKSRMVLIDIINKNVLQKLHNMMKKCRRDFKKLPILRKVLKVLEYLAFREALTLEHISKGPPHPGVESFIESMLSLTEHDDKQVHQIARSFRDRWIPRHVRKICYLDRDEGWTRFCGGQNNKVPGSHNHLQDRDMRPTEALDALRQPELSTTPVDATVNLNCSASSTGSGAKTRKRKTRWDQDKPVWMSPHCDEQKAEFPLEQVSESKESHNMPQETLGQVELLREDVCCPQTTCTVDSGNLNNLEDVPPGFSSAPSKMSSSFSPSTVIHMLKQASPEDLVIGHLQKKFISRLPVSYGIPLPIVQQLGSTRAENVESCIIAPGIAFHPFPPLPPIPHPNKETSSCFANSITTGGASDLLRGSRNPATSYATENSPSTSGTNLSGMDNPGPNGQQAFKRPRGSSHDLGRRYSRQQKWHKMPVPWIRNGTRWGYSGNNFRGGLCARNMGNAAKQHIDLAFSNDVSYRVDNIGNYFNQQSQQLNDH